MSSFLARLLPESMCSRRIFDFKVSVSLFANLWCQILTYLLLEAFIRVTNNLVTFHGENNVLLWVFQRCYVPRICRLNNGRTPSTVDQILAKGDRLFLDALQSRSIPETETLSLNYLPNVAHWSIETNNLNDMPVREQTNDLLIWAESQTNDPLLRVDTNKLLRADIESPIRQTNTDLPAVDVKLQKLFLIYCSNNWYYVIRDSKMTVIDPINKFDCKIIKICMYIYCF